MQLSKDSVHLARPRGLSWWVNVITATAAALAVAVAVLTADLTAKAASVAFAAGDIEAGQLASIQSGGWTNAAAILAVIAVPLLCALGAGRERK